MSSLNASIPLETKERLTKLCNSFGASSGSLPYVHDILKFSAKLGPAEVLGRLHGFRERLFIDGRTSDSDRLDRLIASLYRDEARLVRSYAD